MSKFGWMTKACGIALLWPMAAVALPAQTFTTLATFDGTDGGSPHGDLIQATDGNFYGTTDAGGANSNNACTGYEFNACGTVFKVTPSGTLTTLYSFCSQSNCADGYIPNGPLVQGADGNFYGTTLGGGAYDDDCVVGTCGGTVFKITPGGTLTTLYSFSAGAGGHGPTGGLAQAANGDFYGTTGYGGSNSRSCSEEGGCGTVFTITPNGTLTTLHDFDYTDGSNPLAGLIQGKDGNFYGTTIRGGTSSACFVGCGTVFKIIPSGTLTTLVSFDGTDGSEPSVALVQGINGDFYGTTDFGGTNGGYGTVFKITPSGVLTTLHSFAGYPTDGSGPEGALVQGSDGNLYGTTFEGGAYSCGVYDIGCGTVFTITPRGTLTILYSFDNKIPHGIEPIGALVQSTNGSFYGTTYYGGANGVCGTFDKVSCGTIFSLSVGLKPFVETEPTSGTVGTPVNILGSNLTGATNVTFNGTPAEFTVVSKTLTTTTVPVGATTGTVEVVRPNGKGLSNVPFTVLQ
jgi:uncharacterized repeat protein (TIGR03803 family)